MLPEDGLPRTGFLRLKSILAPRGPIPVSKSTWWDGIRKGRYPAPVKLGPRITAWSVEDIRALIKQMTRVQSTSGPHRSITQACYTETLPHAGLPKGAVSPSETRSRRGRR
jgi:prophage regulatory protein